MKKVDFHIHTVATPCETNFDFSLSKMKEYVENANLDCIAITNHNIFDLLQFEEISNALDVPVFPGIEVDVEKGQILVIADNDNLADFADKCLEIHTKCEHNDGWVGIDFFEATFGDLSQYLLIPHYLKRPALREDALERLDAYISAGEVTSPKKFMYCIKDQHRLVPVIFSDSRISEELHPLPVRQTYLDCDTIDFVTIKSCLRDKNKVSLSREDGNSLFQIFEDGQKLSTGLNVIIGERSSGKSFTLSNIMKNADNARYIKQFALVARDEEEDKRKFNEHLSQKQSLYSKEYLKDLQAVVDEMLDVDIEADQRSIIHYLETLKKYAKETEKHDAYSKAKLFSESKFPAIDQGGLITLIESTKNLVSNVDYREVIEKHLPLPDIKSLYVKLMNIYSTKEESRMKKIWVNELIQQVKEKLQRRTAAPAIGDIDPYRIIMNLQRVTKFRSVVEQARKPRVAYRKQKRGFEIVAEVGPFEGAQELKSLSKSQIGFSSAYNDYADPYIYLQALKKLDDRIAVADYYKFFVKIDYKILNKSGFEASGGERSEFFLLEAIEDARSYDMLLIDEPESSFDNIFLKSEVNEILKDISKDMPVVLVTHNNTVGASIRPDYLICTRKEIKQNEVNWHIYSGFPTNKQLTSVCGNNVNTREIIMGCLEAGVDAYETRKQAYEDLKN